MQEDFIKFFRSQVEKGSIIICGVKVLKNLLASPQKIISPFKFANFVLINYEN